MSNGQDDPLPAELRGRGRQRGHHLPPYVMAFVTVVTVCAVTCDGLDFCKLLIINTCYGVTGVQGDAHDDDHNDDERKCRTKAALMLYKLSLGYVRASYMPGGLARGRAVALAFGGSGLGANLHPGPGAG